MPLKAGHFSVKIPGQVSVEINIETVGAFGIITIRRNEAAESCEHACLSDVVGPQKMRALAAEEGDVEPARWRGCFREQAVGTGQGIDLVVFAAVRKIRELRRESGIPCGTKHGQLAGFNQRRHWGGAGNFGTGFGGGDNVMPGEARGEPGDLLLAGLARILRQTDDDGMAIAGRGGDDGFTHFVRACAQTDDIEHLAGAIGRAL